MLVKKWRRVTHEATGISFDVGRLTYKQAPALDVLFADVFGPGRQHLDAEGKPKKGVTIEQSREATMESLRALDKHEPLITELFTNRVRNVEGLEAEDADGNVTPVMTGPELLDEADLSILILVLGELNRSTKLSVEEGKDSKSPSTSLVDQRSDSDSVVTFTESADGTLRSTVPETPVGMVSSTPVA